MASKARAVPDRVVGTFIPSELPLSGNPLGVEPVGPAAERGDPGADLGRRRLAPADRAPGGLADEGVPGHAPGVRYLTAVLFLGVTLGACGRNAATATPRAAAEAYVAAIGERDWAAACAVSVGGEGDGCPRLLRKAREDGTPTPSVEEAERVTERRGDRYLVHVEVQTIR